MSTGRATSAEVDSRYAWARLFASLVLMTIGGASMYTIAVTLAPVQAEFAATRGDASLPYTLAMIGFGLGSMLMGRVSDRFGVWVAAMTGSICLSLGYMASGLSGSLWQFSLTQGVLVGLLGTASTFSPLIADTTRWFERRRGIALAICMSGNYLAGALWSPVIQHFVGTVGWRTTYIGMGVICLITMMPLSLALRRKSPDYETTTVTTSAVAPKIINSRMASDRPLGMSPGQLQALLCIASVGCCVAMSMPQVHIVAYCTDLGFGAARGAEMLSLMLAMGIISRLISGWISDHIGGLRTLLLGSVLQGIALLMFLITDALPSLYLIAGLFGLFQGGIVPSYALIVREYFTPREAGARVGTVLMCSLFGMAFGGWVSGAIFDFTGSYRAAFLNGTVWNVLNVAIVVFLLLRVRGGGARRPSFAA